MSTSNNDKPKPNAPQPKPNPPQSTKESIPLDPGWIQIVKKGGSGPNEIKEKPSQPQKK